MKCKERRKWSWLLIMLLGMLVDQASVEGQPPDPYTLEFAAVSSGGTASDDGDLLVIGRSPVGVVSNEHYTFEIGAVPVFAALMNACDPACAPQVVSTRSCLVHDDGGQHEAEWCLDLAESNGVEPRFGGPRLLRVELSENIDPATVSAGNVQVVCENQEPSILDAFLDGAAALAVQFDADPLIFADCCSFAFEGMLSAGGAPFSDSVNLRILQGDINFDGGVTGGDAVMIKPFFGRLVGEELVTPNLDFNRDGAVTGGDYALIKPLLGNQAADCPH